MGEISNYKGYVLKSPVGIVEEKYLTGFRSTPNRQTDKNSYTDGDGETHRKILPHLRTTITFTTPMLYLEDKIKLQAHFPKREIVQLEYWNDETNGYKSGKFYIPDVEFSHKMHYGNTILYEAITIELQEY